MRTEVLYTKKVVQVLEQMSTADQLALKAWITRHLIRNVQTEKYGYPVRGAENIRYYRAGDHELAVERRDNKWLIIGVDHMIPWRKQMSRLIAYQQRLMEKPSEEELDWE